MRSFSGTNEKKKEQFQPFAPCDPRGSQRKRFRWGISYENKFVNCNLIPLKSRNIQLKIKFFVIFINENSIDIISGMLWKNKIELEHSMKYSDKITKRVIFT